MNEALVRLGLAVAIAAAGFVLFRVVSLVILGRARRATSLLPQQGLPGVIYFTTPDCQACKSLQRPALEAMRSRRLGRIQVVEIDAAERPELAREWGVMTVPTTIIVDGRGRPKHVNHGVASADKLLHQLARIEAL